MSLLPIHTTNLLGYDPTTIYLNPCTMKMYADLNKITTHEKRSFPDVRKVIPTVKHAKVSKIKLMLGTACNYRCKYCRQKDHQSLVHFSDIDICNIITHIQSVADFNKDFTVEFWGGEPLLYFEDMIAISNRLPTATKYHIVSNGSLMDKDVYKWLKNKPFEFILSHDGVSQHMRSGDPLTDNTSYKYLHKLYLLNKKHDYQEFKINTVLSTSESLILSTLYWMMAEYFGKDIHIAKVEPVIPYNDHAFNTTTQYNSYTKVEERLLESIIELRELGVLEQFLDIHKTIEDYIYQTNDPNFIIDFTQPKCYLSSLHSVCLDRNGIVYPCQVYGESNVQLGTIDTHPHYHGNIDKLPYTMLDHQKCITCPIVGICRGVCPYIDRQYVQSNCTNKYSFYMAIWKYIMYQSRRLVTRIGSPISEHSLHIQQG